MAEIRLQGLSKRFGRVEVFKNLNLTIKDGEFFTILGPSGCGKSTLLNIIAGLETPTEGRVFFDSEDVTHLSPKQRDVAMVFQSYALYPHMSVFDNIAFPLKMRKVDRRQIRQEVERVAEILGLKELLHRKPRELSGGQRQRVALGRAIIRRPRVFLMDEPLSNLDARLRVQMRTELKRLHRGLGTTVIYVTHDQSEAMALSDRIAIMQQGQIQQCGSPEEVYKTPVNLFVATFIGSPVMNVVKTRIISTDPLSVAFAGLRFDCRVSGELKGAEVLLGIRPEDILIQSSGEGIRAEVEFVEPEGSRYVVDLVLNAQRIKAVSSDAFRVAESVVVRFVPDRIHLFEPVTGQRITCK